MNSILTKTLLSEVVAASLFFGPLALAAELNLSSTPLITSAAVSPNMMLLLDTSGSMSNIVPDIPYDATTYTYDCPADTTLASGSVSVDIRIQALGNAYFNEYDFGNSGVADTGITGKTKKCFADAGVYSARLLADGTGDPRQPTSYAYGSYSGRYLNWYFANPSTNQGANFGIGADRHSGTKTRMEIAKVAAIELISGLTNIRIGLSTYDGGTGAKIHFDIDDLTVTTKPLLTAQITSITNSGSTPLGGAMSQLGRYFTLNAASADPSLQLHPETNGASALASALFGSLPSNNTGNTLQPPTQYWCQQNFIVALTDGLPMNDTGGTDLLKTYADDASASFVDDAALALFDMDLRPDLTDGADAVKNNVSTYMVGFADDQVMDNPLMQDTADNGGGTFITAADSAGLVNAFRSTSDSIFNKVGAMASVSFNTSQLTANSGLYTASFNTAGWKGSLQAFPLSGTGALEAQAWDAATVLNNMDFTARKIFSYNQDTSLGVAFSRVNLSAAQRADLAAGIDADGDGTQGDDDDLDLLINYLRGDRSKEGTAATNYRTRSGRLGDIVNSTSIYVGAPDLSWPDYSVNDMFGATDNNYSSFKSANANRMPMVYVGANDGMLHGFNAQLTGTDAGKEQFAYIPGSLASSDDQAGLHYLAEQNYLHRFYVDLTPTVSDVYIGGWRTLLIGGLRAGGKGLFALDVSNPASFAEGNVLWEFSSADDADLGYTYSKPTVAMMANGKWAVIVGNGYNNGGDGKAKLFILFIEEGIDGTWSAGDYIKIDTGVGDTTTPNGLATPRAVDLDNDGVVDRIYAGDLQGNMWAFDVDRAPTNGQPWEVDYATGNGSNAIPAPLFTAADSSGNAQPITSAPLLSKNPNASSSNSNAPNILVFFGTGKYLEATDVTTNRDVMSYYSVLDAGVGSQTRSNLAPRELVTNAGLRTIGGSAIDWASQSGWYFDLLNRASTGAAGSEQGERVIADSLIRRKVLFFNTVIPDGIECSSGGNGWLMSLDLETGLAPVHGVFDANKDGVIDKEGTDSDNDGVDDHGGDMGYIGEFFDQGIPSAPAVLGDTQYTAGSTGALEAREIYVGKGGHEGRLSWLEHIR